MKLKTVVLILLSMAISACSHHHTYQPRKNVIAGDAAPLAGKKVAFDFSGVSDEYQTSANINYT